METAAFLIPCAKEKRAGGKKRPVLFQMSGNNIIFSREEGFKWKFSPGVFFGGSNKLHAR